jgi:streptomycin 6-kinase
MQPSDDRSAVNAAMHVRVPEELVAWHLKLYGQATRPWIDAAPGVVDELLGRWGLRVDGSATNGSVSLIVPVVREGGVRAVLKLPPQIEESRDKREFDPFFDWLRFRGEPAALRAWNGNGAVRLLEHDPETGSMLLERLDATSSLATIPDDMEAFQLLSELLARLTAIAAPPGLPLLSDIGAELLDRVQSALRRSLPESQRSLLVQCSAALREVLPEPGDRLLHGDLGPGNVLASGPEDPREPWLAIDPTPFAGDPCFDLLLPLHHRWEDAVATGDVRRAVQRRFDLMTEVVGLDRKRATAWTLGRVLQSMLWDIEHDATASFTEHEADKTIALTLLARRT